jgi:peptidoglycan/LPS O-acetylase OafA/YrhL
VTDSPKTLLGNLVFLQTIRVPTFGSDFPLWSLANEFWYYVLFPCVALLWFVKRGGMRIVFAAIFLVVMVALPFAISIAFLIWLLGTAVFMFPPPRRFPGLQTAWIVGISAIALFAVLAASRSHHLSAAWTDNLLGVAFAALLYGMAHGSLPAAEAYRRVAKFIAASSYTVYLVHFPFFACCLAAIGRRWMPDALHLSFATALLAAGYGYAVVIAALFEMRTGRVKQWLAPRLGIG